MTRKGLEKKLDEIVKKIVFARDGQCVTCPIWKKIKEDFKGSDVMQPGHFFTRGAKSVKWDLRNVYQQCKTCNFLHEYHPDVLLQHVLKTIGQEEFESLTFKRHSAKPIKMYDLEELYKDLEKRLVSDFG